MKNTHEDFMNEAIALSEQSVANGGGPFGAVVVKNGEIIARGSNMVTVDNDPTAHGEVVAIRNACDALDTFNLEGCTLYTSAEPCTMCFGAIYWARLDALYFGNSIEDAKKINFDDVFIYEEIEKEGSERSIPFIQIGRDSAQKAFKMWEEKEDKTEY